MYYIVVRNSRNEIIEKYTAKTKKEALSKRSSLYMKAKRAKKNLKFSYGENLDKLMQGSARMNKDETNFIVDDLEKSLRKIAAEIENAIMLNQKISDEITNIFSKFSRAKRDEAK